MEKLGQMCINICTVCGEPIIAYSEQKCFSQCYVFCKSHYYERLERRINDINFEELKQTVRGVTNE